jgi:LCP family protein required for cell wall assembly
MLAEPSEPQPAPSQPAPRRRRPWLAALLSFIWPGLGQAYRGNRQRALAHALPSALAVGALIVVLLVIGPLIFGVHLLNPIVSLALIGLIALLGLARVWSIVDAAWPRTAAANVMALALIVLVVISHAWLANNAWAFFEAGQRISQPVDVGGAPVTTPGPSPTSSTQPGESPAASPSATADTASPLPGATSRVTVLLVGVDNTHAAERGLTDTLIVASFDPVGRSMTMISMPRDVSRLPFYAGGEFRPRINNLMQTAARDPEQYPDGAMGTLVNQMSYIVGVPIDYYALIDISGFTLLVDAVGGVDVLVEQPINDAGYQFTPTETGFFLEAGPQHLDGKYATAYARSRHGPGNSDYERARRQQQILLALRSKLDDPRIVTNVPAVVGALSQIIRTDAPLDRLPDIVSIAVASAEAETRRIVLSPPRYARGARTETGQPTSALELNMDAVAELSVEIFGSDSRYAQQPAP